MRIAVRRKDSVSSILLFLFNVFLVERGMTSIPLRKIFELLRPFGKNETTIRMSLSREVKGDTLANAREGGEVVYRLTATALEGFRHWMSVMDHDRTKIRMQTDPWDGAWRLAAVRVDEDTSPMPAAAREEFRNRGYGRLNRDTWISPYDLRADLESALAARNPDTPRLCWFECPSGNAPERTALAADLWPIAEVGDRYRAFAASLAEGAYPTEEGSELPALYRIGLDYFEIAQDDPRLPILLLPADWPGLEAAKRFGAARSELLPKGRAYVDSILAEA